MMVIFGERNLNEILLFLYAEWGGWRSLLPTMYHKLIVKYSVLWQRFVLYEQQKDSSSTILVDDTQIFDFWFPKYEFII